jgi:hypothetical protein
MKWSDAYNTLCEVNREVDRIAVSLAPLELLPGASDQYRQSFADRIQEVEQTLSVLADRIREHQEEVCGAVEEADGHIYGTCTRGKNHAGPHQEFRETTLWCEW